MGHCNSRSVATSERICRSQLCTDVVHTRQIWQFTWVKFTDISNHSFPGDICFGYDYSVTSAEDVTPAFWQGLLPSPMTKPTTAELCCCVSVRLAPSVHAGLLFWALWTRSDQHTRHRRALLWGLDNHSLQEVMVSRDPLIVLITADGQGAVHAGKPRAKHWVEIYEGVGPAPESAYLNKQGLRERDEEEYTALPPSHGMKYTLHRKMPMESIGKQKDCCPLSLLSLLSQVIHPCNGSPPELLNDLAGNKRPLNAHAMKLNYFSPLCLLYQIQAASSSI